MAMSSAASISVSEAKYSRPLFRRDFHVAIVCALPLEYDAACLLVDEFWDQDGKQYGRTSGDSNTYRNGRIGRHNVVLMLLPNMGKVTGAGSAGSLRTSYTRINLAFLVGVCGGVPGTHDMALGDVVVSDDLVQYDFGKQYPGQSVTSDTIQVHPRAQPKEIRSLLAYFRTESGKNDLRVDTAKHMSALQDAAVSKCYTCSYQYPGPAEDKLFSAKYRHKHREPSTCNLCCGAAEAFCDEAGATPCAELGCDEAFLLPRPRLTTHRGEKGQRNQSPEVFIGRIASADRVMKSGEHRDQVAKKYNVIAFEMEGAGLWDEIPTIVVKGVCDYADSHKNKPWQPFAAAAAASVTKSILNRYHIAGCVESVLCTIDHTNRDRSPSLAPNTENTVSPTGSQHTTIPNLQNINAVPNATSVLVFTAQLDSRNRKRKGSSIASRFHSILQSVRDFSAVIQGSAGCTPGLSSLIWGSVKLTITVIFDLVSHYETLSKVFMNLGKLCPQMAEYNAVYSTSVQLQGSLANFYASIIRCCKDVIKIAQRPWHEDMFGTLWDSLERDFEPHTNEVRRYSENVEHALSQAKEYLKYDMADEQRNISEGRQVTKGIFAQTRRPGNQDDWQVNVNEWRIKERKQQLLDSLSAHDYLTPLKQSRRKRQNGTAEWIFETQEFDSWSNAHGSKVLWCSGKIGSGKTILTASVIDKILTEKRDPEIFVSFFFVRFDDLESLKAEVILNSILKQIIDTTGLSNEMANLIEKSQHNSPCHPEDLLNMLNLAARQVKRLYIIIDGLDECLKGDRHVLLWAFQSLCVVGQNIKVFISGRESVSREVEKMFSHLERVSMSHSSAQSDIATYIENAVQERLQSEDLIVADHTLIEEIKDALKKGADGMFLWVVFQIDTLCSQHCDDDIRQAIRDLPRDLTETFNRALRRIIARHNSDVASRSFRWVAAAKRPLSIDELREAIFIEIGQEYSRPERLPNDIHNIGSWCENLISVDEEKNLLQFVHHTVQQFLVWKDPDPQLETFHFDLSEANHYLGEICVTYLNFNDFKTTIARRPPPPSQILPTEIAHQALHNEKKSTDLLRTMARFTLGASRKSGITNFVDAVSSLTSNDAMIDTKKSEHPFLKYASKYMIFHTTDFREEKSVMWTPWKEMMIYGSHLIKTPYGIKSLKEDDLVVLDWSLAAHHHALLRLVYLGVGSSRSIDRDLVLWKAAERGQLDIVKILLNAGANPHSSNGDETAVHTAVMNSHFDVFEALLLAGADVNSTNWFGLTALHHAAGGGYLNIVIRLLASGADVNEPGLYGETALHRAAAGGFLNVVKGLLASGADVNKPDRNGGTALHRAAGRGSPDIVTRLLASRADVNKPDRNGETALHHAAAGGYLNIVTRLLASGADVNKRGDYGETALIQATKYERWHVVQRLLDEGADLNISKQNGETALHYAVEYGRLDITITLLSKGADVNAIAMKDMHVSLARGTGVGTWSALHIATERGNWAIVYALLEAGADVNAVLVRSHGPHLTALQMAITCGHQHIAEIIERAGGRKYEAEKQGTSM